MDLIQTNNAMIRLVRHNILTMNKPMEKVMSCFWSAIYPNSEKLLRISFRKFTLIIKKICSKSKQIETLFLINVYGNFETLKSL